MWSASMPKAARSSADLPEWGMTERLREGGQDVKSYDPAVEARTASSLEELKGQLDAPRAFWLMEIGRAHV